ncbi:carcinoembryonic antigen-related cell adhesion molecule 5 isoform X4 [Kryptolebias marmoratus]|uniref:carcinoembryonic antigen-related cell adhesion molecule 5 isoform X4 n=1 Tax=Kryptolebias marmoratus TaxID=37003 RepID=UPI0018ACF264|nr:carcinoembryonic antigen-related cell adhesion molecule 5 isoform X4 [Kryptolebias marmoratus]
MFTRLLTLAFGLFLVEFSDGCDQYNATGTKVFVPLKHKLEPGERLTWKYNNEVKVRAKQEEVTSGKAQNIAKDGSYILQNVKKEQSGDYSCEVFDGNGHQTFTSKTHLCVLDPVSKPNVTTECKGSKVNFTCVLGQQPEDAQFKWLQDGKVINETTNPLEKEASETNGKKSSCEVSNKVSSKTSEPSTHDCLVENPVSKPNIMTECKGSKVIFKCVLDQQHKDVKVKWLQDGKEINETTSPLEKEASETKAKHISCEVSNKVSSKTSDPSTHDCLVEILSGIPDELFGISIWFFVAGGGGFVLVLIIIVAVCCVRRKRRRGI